MRYLSVCSGIEAATVAWRPLGWEPAAFAEIEKFPSAVLAHHYPGVPNLGDFTKIGAGDAGPVELLVGGTPCQDFSVAGKRAGLDAPRGNLTLEYLALARRLRPRWLVWENVPGVLSIDEGRTFGTIVGIMGELGYGWAYRILDAQWFGVPQRRRRVFLVGHLGDRRAAAAVLFESEGLRGDPSPRRESGERVTPLLEVGARTNGDGRRDGDGIGEAGDAMYSLQAGKQHGIAHALRGEGFDASEDGTGRGTPIVAFQSKASAHNSMNPAATTPALDAGKSDGLAVAFSCKDHGADAGEVSPPLRALNHDKSHANAGGQVAVAFQEAQTGVREYPESGTLRADGPGHDPVGTRIRDGMAVRRLTPVECEKLQGFPPGYTAIPWRGKPAELCPDGPRYKALGNSMAVPVMAWIGQRIALFEDVMMEVA